MITETSAATPSFAACSNRSAADRGVALAAGCPPVAAHCIRRASDSSARAYMAASSRAWTPSLSSRASTFCVSSSMALVLHRNARAECRERVDLFARQPRRRSLEDLRQFACRSREVEIGLCALLEFPIVAHAFARHAKEFAQAIVLDFFEVRADLFFQRAA